MFFKFKIIILIFLSIFFISSLHKNLISQEDIPSLTLIPTPTPRGNVRMLTMNTKIHKTRDVLPLFLDVNRYLESKKKPSIHLQDVPKIENTVVLKKLSERNRPTPLIIDIRENRETETLLRLYDYPNLRYIRFGDLINNNFEKIPKNREIILIGFTQNREIVAASYLKSQGYTNVTILKGGLLQWVADELPLVLNELLGNNFSHKNIHTILPLYTETDMTKNATSTSTLTFGPYSSNTVPLLLWDKKTLEGYIDSLPKNKSYILTCNYDMYCWNATYFWYLARKKIDIIGYKSTIYSKKEK